MRRQIHLAAAGFGRTADSMSCLQEAGSQGLVHVQLAKDRFDFRCKESGVYGVEARQQGRIREAVTEHFPPLVV